MHEKLIDILKAQYIRKNNLQRIGNLFWLGEAAIRMEGEITGWKEIKRVVLQGCILRSQILIAIYTIHRDDHERKQDFVPRYCC